ncbi:hypothetical protein Trydic_g14530 [Trypoxylus dichotomus]
MHRKNRRRYELLLEKDDAHDGKIKEAGRILRILRRENTNFYLNVFNRSLILPYSNQKLKMAHQIRPLNRENKKPLAMKANLEAASNANRLALGEVGNRIQRNNRLNSDKTEDDEKRERHPGVVKKIASMPVKGVTNEVGAKKKIDKVPNDKKRLLERPKQLLNFVADNEPLANSTKELSEIINVDTSEDPLLVSEYVQDIYEYLLEVQGQLSIKKGFLDNHKSTAQMRIQLVNWLVEVQATFKLLLETLCVAVAITDRYLQANKEIGRESLQLVGATAMWIAAKYEDTSIPEISDLVYLCDDGFTKDQFKKMECEILKVLDFKLGRPLSIHFLRRFSRIGGVNVDQYNLGKYLLELALIDYELCHIKPSLQGAAACCLSISILSDFKDPSEAWTPMLVHYSSHAYRDIKPVIPLMVNALQEEDEDDDGDDDDDEGANLRRQSDGFGATSASPSPKKAQNANQPIDERIGRTAADRVRHGGGRAKHEQQAEQTDERIVLVPPSLGRRRSFPLHPPHPLPYTAAKPHARP